MWGQNAKEGIDLAVEQLNNAGGIDGTRVIVIYEDSQGLPKEGLTAFNKLVTMDKVPVVIGDIASSVVLAVAPIANREEVVLFSPGATAPNISEAGSYVFRNWNSDIVESQVMAEYAYQKLGLRSVAILYINNDYGQGLKEVFSREFKAEGGTITTAEALEQNATDFRAQLTKIKATKPDALYLAAYPGEIPLVLKQATQLGVTAHVLATVAAEDPQVPKVAGKAAEGLTYPYPSPPDPKSQAVTTFVTLYKATYGKEPGIGISNCWDAVNMIAEAIRLSGGSGGPDIQKGLMMLKDFDGASGVMTFDHNGDVHKPMGLKTIHNGEFVWYDKQ